MTKLDAIIEREKQQSPLTIDGMNVREYLDVQFPATIGHSPLNLLISRINWELDHSRTDIALLLRLAKMALAYNNAYGNVERSEDLLPLIQERNEALAALLEEEKP